MKYPYLILLLIFFSLFGCATRDISTPSHALIGHWQNSPEKLDFYFSSDGIFTSPTGLDISTPFTIEDENLKNRTMTIRMSEKSFKLSLFNIRH
jgi:hypothetical protein